MYTQTYEATGHGNFKVTRYGFPVNRNSIVLASATEMSLQDGALRPIVGSAPVQVACVAPQDNGNVDVMMEIGWDIDINYKLCLVVIQS